jgi:hypothetical protein
MGSVDNAAYLLQSSKFFALHPAIKCTRLNVLVFFSYTAYLQSCKSSNSVIHTYFSTSTYKNILGNSNFFSSETSSSAKNFESFHA